MSADEQTDDDGFADLLAAHEEALVQGNTPTGPPPPEFKDRIDDALRTVAMLQQHWSQPEGLLRDPAAGPIRSERYRLLRIHAAGGVGRVWVAEDVRLRRQVALKDLQPERADNPLFADRFLREAQITGRLQHPGVVPVYEMAPAQEGSPPFYTMRLVQGRTLTEVIAAFHQSGVAARPRSLELNALLGAFVSVCNTVAYAHSLGIVHRDIKSANVVLGEFGEVVLVDWGFAKELPQGDKAPDENSTGLGQVVGTPAFMPPEQASARHNDIGPHSDIFGLGAVLYEILTSQPPFSGAGLREVIQKAKETAFVPPRQARPGVPRALAAICERAMARQPADRYATAADLARDVQRWVAEEPTSAYPEPIIDRWRRWGRRHRSVVVGLAALMGTTFIALLIGLWLTERNQARLAAQKEADRETLEGHLYVERLALAERELAAHNLSRASQLLTDCPADRRGWEWGCLERLCHTDLTILRGHEAPVSGAVFCLDGTAIVSGSHDHTLRIWDARTGRELKTLPGQGAVIHYLAVSPDGERVASGGWDQQARIWDIRTGRELRSVSGHNDIVIRVAFVDNRRLAAVSGSVVSVWDTETGQELRHFERPKVAIYGLAISPDQRLLATGGSDNFIHIWDVNTGNEVRSWCGHRSPPKHLAFSPDGRLLAAGDGGTLEDEPGTVKLWEVETGREVARLEGHTYPVYSVAFSPDGRRLVSGSQDNSIKVWDVAHGSLMLTLRGHSDIVRSLAFSRDGHRLISASADRTVRIWDASPWDTERPPGESEAPRDHGEAVLGVGFSGPNLVSMSRSSSFKRWKTEGTAAQIESMMAAGHETFQSFAVSPAGDVMVLGTSSGAVLIGDPATGKKVSELLGYGAGPIKGMAFTTDGKRLATAEWRGTVRVWDMKSGQPSAAFKGHTEPVVVVAFSPDGRTVASGSYDQTVRIWDAETGKEMHRLTGHKSRLSAVAFRPGGRLLASASTDGRIKLWDLETAREVRDLDAHGGTIAGLEFSPDGQWLASAGDDRAIKLWNVETGEVATTFRGHTGAVRALVFERSGQRLATGDQNGSVRVWQVPR